MVLNGWIVTLNDKAMLAHCTSIALPIFNKEITRYYRSRLHCCRFHQCAANEHCALGQS
jgi:hypothetical protein